MHDLKEKLEQYVKKVKEDCQSCKRNEAATKAALIAPLFAILGYNMADPRECKPEYRADFGEGRSVKPVDWAFCVSDPSPTFLVEAKAVGEEINSYDEQLGDYYGKEQPAVVLGILTTGVQWRFFTDLACEHVMDKRPFLKWDILDDDAMPCDFLAILHRTVFQSELIKTFARRQHRQSLLVAELTQLLEPSSEFVRLAIHNIEELEGHKLTEAVIEEWKPIVLRATREWAQQQRLTMALEAIDTHDDDQPGRSPTDAQLPATHRVLLKDLIDTGFLKPPLKLKKCYLHTDLEADLQPSGVITFQGNEYGRPSNAAVAAASQVAGAEKVVGGWFFWQYQDVSGNWVPLDVARKAYLARDTRQQEPENTGGSS